MGHADPAVTDGGLGVLVSSVNQSKEPKQHGTALILTVSGLVVRGKPIPDWQWFEEVEKPATYNTVHRATRCRGERGFALLTGRWRALQRGTVSPRRIGELAQAALVLTRIENVKLRTSC